MRRVRNADDGARKRAVLAMSMTPDPALVQAARDVYRRLDVLTLSEDSADLEAQTDANVAILATFGAEQRATGFQDWGPLFHRDLTRELGLPESTSLDDTMAEVRRILAGVRHIEDFASRLSHSTEQKMLANKLAALRAARPEGT